MKYNLWGIALLLCVSCLAQAEHTQIQHDKQVKGKLVHTVLFWLNNPDNKEETKAFEKGVIDLLNQCTFITSSHIGKPANTTKRPIIDDSYTYCVVITFENKEAHDKYQVDPLHKKFITENEGLWKKVLIYDSQLVE